MAEKLDFRYEELKAEMPINITAELTKMFDSVNKSLSDVYKLPLKHTLLAKQRILKTEARFKNTWMIENNPVQKVQSNWETHAPRHLDQKTSRLPL